MVAKHPEVITYFSAIGVRENAQVSQGFMFVRLQPREQRTIRQQDFLKTLRDELAAVPGGRPFPRRCPSWRVSGASPCSSI